MWIITIRPLALGGKMYEVLRDRLKVGQTKYVYFLDWNAGETTFRALWKRLEQDKQPTNQLECVLTPSSLCIQHYGIAQPGWCLRSYVWSRDRVFLRNANRLYIDGP